MFSHKKIFPIVLLLMTALILAACGSAGNEQSNTSDAVEVQITLTEYGVESSVSVFEVGVPYHFTVVNEGEEEHEIMLMPQMSTDEMLALMEGDDHDAGDSHEEDNSHDDDDMMAEDDHEDDGDSHNDGEDDHSHDMLMEEGIVLAAVDAHDLQPGESASFEYTFTEVTSFGEIEFACHLEGHYEEGMFLPLWVQ